MKFTKDGNPQPYPEIIKILRLPQPEVSPFISTTKITCINFGPYDNGYLMLGTSSGHLIALDPYTLKRINS